MMRIRSNITYLSILRLFVRECDQRSNEVSFFIEVPRSEKGQAFAYLLKKLNTEWKLPLNQKQKIIYVMFPCWLLNPGNNISRYLLISESLASLALVDFGTVFLQLKNKLQLLTVGIGGVGLVWTATFTCPPFVRT
ncbi:uncharacterized protein LOC108824188 [Raphanus sativus]|uniref:Uncharacterized protein LOC108824188 n=1 Tax=Raphanus sativus TaxID=3726 RepID=A0A9W3BWV3_RAPSA|nr:uncharacterized protein LOC108824188 [Raphanus sativus]